MIMGDFNLLLTDEMMKGIYPRPFLGRCPIEQNLDGERYFFSDCYGS